MVAVALESTGARGEAHTPARNFNPQTAKMFKTAEHRQSSNIDQLMEKELLRDAEVDHDQEDYQDSKVVRDLPEG